MQYKWKKQPLTEKQKVDRAIKEYRYWKYSLKQEQAKLWAYNSPFDDKKYKK